MISNYAIFLFILQLIFAVGFPVVLSVVWIKKTKQSVVTILTGAGIFFGFAIILELIPEFILLTPYTGIGEKVLANSMLTILVGAFIAGLFEETGRFFAFRFLLKNKKDKLTSVSYGIGHGGFEVLYLLATAAITNLYYTYMINSGSFTGWLEQISEFSPEQAEAMKTVPDLLMAVTLGQVLIAFIERISAMLIHVSCSMIMFKAVREKGKIWLFPVSIIVHAMVDIIAGLYQLNYIKSSVMVESILLLFAVVIFVITYIFVYKKMLVTYEQNGELTKNEA